MNLKEDAPRGFAHVGCPFRLPGAGRRRRAVAIEVSAAQASTPSSVPAYEVPGGGGGVDILFMIDNSSSMTSMQQKLLAQIPMFLDTLQSAERPLSDFHIAVVSSDLGAPGDSTSSILCTSEGDQGSFRANRGATARGALAPGATYISNVGGVANYTGQLTDVLACITPLGAERLRLRAPARVGRPGARCRRTAGARGQRRLPAPGRRAGDLPSDQ